MIPGIPPVFVFFLVAVIQHLEETQLKREGFFGSQVQVTVYLDGLQCNQQQEPELITLHSQVKERAMYACSFLFPLKQSGIPARELCHPQWAGLTIQSSVPLEACLLSHDLAIPRSRGRK